MVLHQHFVCGGGNNGAHGGTRVYLADLHMQFDKLVVGLKRRLSVGDECKMWNDPMNAQTTRNECKWKASTWLLDSGLSDRARIDMELPTGRATMTTE